MQTYDINAGKKLVRIAVPKRCGMLTGVTFSAEASDALNANTTDLFEGKAYG